MICHRDSAGSGGWQTAAERKREAWKGRTSTRAKKWEEEEKEENTDAVDHVTTKRAIPRRHGERGGREGGGGGVKERMEEAWEWVEEGNMVEGLQGLQWRAGEAWEVVATVGRSRVVRDRDRKEIARWWRAREVITRCGGVAARGGG